MEAPEPSIKIPSERDGERTPHESVRGKGVSGNVILVDDDEATCELLQSVLQSQGYEVSYETSAETALQRVREADFDVMLTDLNMDGMGGIELCRRVNEVLPDGVPFDAPCATR